MSAFRQANTNASERMISSCRGALLGMAAGDALGTTLEFKSPGSFQPIADMVGGGPFALRPGEWTDDTSMGLCLAESLVERGGFEPVDQLERYVRWWREGHLSSNGLCFDIGVQTRAALAEFERTGSAQPLPPDPRRAGNGSIMRLAAVPVAFAPDIEAAIKYSVWSSLTTHPAPQSVDACRYLGALIAAAASGAGGEELLDDGFWRWGPLHAEVEKVARGSYKRRQPPEIRGSGYCVHTLEAALWALHGTDSFREGALRAVNLGDDADTTGAVFGQLAGALYGEGGIPAEWRQKLALHDMIRALADHLRAMTPGTPGPPAAGPTACPTVRARRSPTQQTAQGLAAAAIDDGEATPRRGAAASVQEFRDDDAGYLNWVEANQDGYVLNIRRDLNPSDAKLHHSSCGYVSGQNPRKGPWTGRYIKVCSLDFGALEEWPPRGPIHRCGRCWPSSAEVGVGSASDLHAIKSSEQSSQPRTYPARTEVDGPLVGQPVVQAWSDAYIRFEHRSVEQESVRAEIRSRVRQLEAAPDQVLHASYLGRKHPAADVENLALYNIDDTGAAFVNAARSGLRFELGPTSRRSPSGAEYAYGYRYALAPRDGGFEHWQEGPTLASWEWVELGPFSGSKKLEQVWIAVARAPARIAWPARSPDTPFLVRVTIRVPKGTTAVLGGLVKGIVDGIVCAFQAHTDRSTIADLAARVSKTVPASAQEVEDLLLDQRKAVLGAVPRLLHARGPGVIWAPSDELCVAGELLIDRSESTTWSIEGSILEAEPVDGPIATGQAGPAGQAVVLWGDDHPALGERHIVALSDRCAIGLTAGDRPKGYAHTDPNEDGVAAIERADGTLLVCADGHNGVSSTHAAIDTLLARLGPLPAPGELSDDRLVDLWHEANQRVIEAGRSALQPESRTTLILVLVSDGVMLWAAMGDSLLAVVVPGRPVRGLNRPRSHFVGWPMTRGEVAERLQRGTEDLPAGATVITATDGLTDFVPDLDSALARASGHVRASTAVDVLLQDAFAGGAGDNVAVGVARVRRLSSTQPPPAGDDAHSRPPPGQLPHASQ